MRFAAIALAALMGAAAVTANPFAGQTFYVSPSYQAELDTSISTSNDSSVTSTLQKMRNVPSAYWIDVKSKINNEVKQILDDAASKSPAELVVLIVYDVPNRDCHAKASNGEICCYKNADGTCDYSQTGDCAAGIEEYKTTYVDPIAALFAEYQDKVPIVAVIEPDSLPNLATNLADPHCGNIATQTAYKVGIPYAIQTIASKAPKVSMYIDAAHGGWLGWTNNMQEFASLLSGLDVLQHVRGFATNVANYQPLGIQCPSVGYCLNGQHQSDPCCADPCRLESQYNPANNELNYVAVVTQAFSSVGFNPYFVIDTGRNGVADMRQDCANWCNIRNAGVGLVPTTATGSSMIDAYFWLKTPGESDGCTQTLPDGSACPRFDSMCGSTDSIGSQYGEPRAPEAGKWFDYQIKQLAKNANMGSGTLPTGAPSAAGPTSAPVTRAPSVTPVTPQPTSAPTSGGSCTNKVYDQCGGQSFTGSQCCPAGSVCKSQNQYYSQCLPAAAQ